MNEIMVSDLMTHLVVAFRPKDGIPEAARRLLDNHISGAPVVDDGRLVGVVSEVDLAAAYAPPISTGAHRVPSHALTFLVRRTVPREVDHLTVGDVMTTSVVSISPDSSAWEAASLMDRQGVRRLPVVDSEGRVLGILARADLVRAMARWLPVPLDSRV